ncbi:MAG: hypothetical protein QOI66_4376, partial [Myxococcales bacterium]|nr:hypothetical protein [Myxococcales bacterium]
VRDPAGVVRAVRQVASDRARAAACAVAAETVAAIGVRAFQPVEWNSGERPDASPAAAAPTPAPGAASEVASSPVASAASAARADFPRGRLTVAAGPAFISVPSAGINVGVDASVLIKGPVAVRIGGLLLPQHQQERAGLAGTASLTRVSAWTGLTWTGQKRAVGFEVGPALAASFDSARTDAISQPGAGRRVVLACGLLAGLGWPIDRRWRVGIVAALLGRLAASDFSVATDAQDAPALRAPSLTAFAALRVEWTIFP